MIFWQKLTNLNDVTYAINLFSVEIDKKKLQSSNIPLQTYDWSVFSIENFENIQKICQLAQNGGKNDVIIKNADVIKFQKFWYQIKVLPLLIHFVYNTS